MEKFDPIFFKNFHLDIKSLGYNDSQLKEWYEKNGLNKGRMCCESDFYSLYPDFEFDFYKNYHTDLSVYNEDKYWYMSHYHIYGYKEGRIINKKFLNLKIKKEYVCNQFPFLFHKFLLNIVEPCNSLHYQIIFQGLNKKKEICHIHCYKISFLQTMFAPYLELIQSCFEIIVTFNVLDDEKILLFMQKKKNITILKCKNKGLDIGPRYIVYDFLERKKSDYHYIFFIHSKSNMDKRKEYLEPFIKNIENIKELLKDKKVGAIFNDIIYCGNQVLFIHNQLIKIDTQKINWDKNDLYMKDLVNYFHLNKENYLFSEGNFFILHRKVIKLLYSDILLYTILNTESSFDFNWVKKNYGLQENSLEKVYKEYKIKNWYGNNIETNMGWNGYPDGMLEHSLERLPMILTNHLRLGIKIVSNSYSPNILLIEKLSNSDIKNNENYFYF